METYRENREADMRLVRALESEVKILSGQAATQAATSQINGQRLATIEELVRELPGEIIATITNAENIALMRMGK